MTTFSIDAYRDDPLRPPDWRWHVAGKLARSHGRIPTIAHDEFLERGAHYRRWASRGSAPNLDDVVHRAAQLATAGDRLKLEIEARLIAGEGPRATSQATDQPADVIQCFAELFFDVLPRLDAADYICCSVLRQRRAGQPERANQMRRVALTLAYAGGPTAAHFVIEHLESIEKAIARPLEALAAMSEQEIILAAVSVLLTAVLPVEDWVRIVSIEPRLMSRRAQHDGVNDVLADELAAKAANLDLPELRRQTVGQEVGQPCNPGSIKSWAG